MPITRCKLAKEVGRGVKKYIEASMFSPRFGAIAKGCNHVQAQGLQGTFALEKIYLTRLDRVSKSSWQPVLCYEDPVGEGLGG